MIKVLKFLKRQSLIKWLVVAGILFVIWRFRLYKPQVIKNYISTMTGSMLKDAASKQKVADVAAYLGISPIWLEADMFNESSLNPSAVNPVSGATGLIQFMPKEAVALGTTCDALADMDFVTQMDWVQKYYEPYKGRMNSYADLYLADFYPAAIGKSADYIVGGVNVDGSPTDTALAIAKGNRSYVDPDLGVVTKGKIIEVVVARAKKHGYDVS